MKADDFLDAPESPAPPSGASSLGSASDFLASDTSQPEDTGAVMTATPSIGDELVAGNYHNALHRIYEPVREQFSGLIGPTEDERLRDSVPVLQPDGSHTYEYKPYGNRLEQEQGLMTPFVPVPHFAPDPTDGTATAIGKGAFNTFTGIAGSFMSPGGALLPGAGVEPVIARTAAGAFGVDMASNIPGQVKQAFTAPTLQEKVEGGLGAVTSTVMAAGAGYHAFHTPELPPSVPPPDPAAAASAPEPAVAPAPAVDSTKAPAPAPTAPAAATGGVITDLKGGVHTIQSVAPDGSATATAPDGTTNVWPPASLERLVAKGGSVTMPDGKAASSPAAAVDDEADPAAPIPVEDEPTPAPAAAPAAAPVPATLKEMGQLLQDHVDSVYAQNAWSALREGMSPEAQAKADGILRKVNTGAPLDSNEIGILKTIHDFVTQHVAAQKATDAAADAPVLDDTPVANAAEQAAAVATNVAPVAPATADALRMVTSKAVVEHTDPTEPTPEPSNVTPAADVPPPADAGAAAIEPPAPTDVPPETTPEGSVPASPILPADSLAAAPPDDLASPAPGSVPAPSEEEETGLETGQNEGTDTPAAEDVANPPAGTNLPDQSGELGDGVASGDGNAPAPDPQAAPDVAPDGKAWVVPWADGRAQGTFRTRAEAEAFAADPENDAQPPTFGDKPPGARYAEDKLTFKSRVGADGKPIIRIKAPAIDAEADEPAEPTRDPAKGSRTTTPEFQLSGAKTKFMEATMKRPAFPGEDGILAKAHAWLDSLRPTLRSDLSGYLDFHPDDKIVDDVISKFHRQLRDGKIDPDATGQEGEKPNAQQALKTILDTSTKDFLRRVDVRSDMRPTSVDAPIGEEGGATRGDMLPAPDEEDKAETAARGVAKGLQIDDLINGFLATDAGRGLTHDAILTALERMTAREDLTRKEAALVKQFKDYAQSTRRSEGPRGVEEGADTQVSGRPQEQSTANDPPDGRGGSVQQQPVDESTRQGGATEPEARGAATPAPAEDAGRTPAAEEEAADTFTPRPGQRVSHGRRAFDIKNIDDETATGTYKGSKKSVKVPVAELKPAIRNKFHLAMTPGETEDVIDAIQKEGKIQGSVAAKRIAKGKGLSTEGDYDDRPNVNGVYQNSVFGGKVAPDVMASRLAGRFGLPEDARASDLYRAIEEAVRGRRSAADETARVETLQKQHDDFTSDVREGKRGEKKVTAENLSVGDVLTMDNGEKLTVTDLDEDGNVELSDGDKYGIQEVKPDEVVWFEKRKAAPKVDDDGWLNDPATEPSHSLPSEADRADASSTTHSSSVEDDEHGGTQATEVDRPKESDPGEEGLKPGDNSSQETPLSADDRASDEGKLPTLRRNENQGDLLSSQSEDLTLVGEKGTDYAARQAEQDRVARESAEAEAAQAKNQTVLFDRADEQPPVPVDPKELDKLQSDARELELRKARGAAKQPGVPMEDRVIADRQRGKEALLRRLNMEAAKGGLPREAADVMRQFIGDLSDTVLSDNALSILGRGDAQGSFDFASGLMRLMRENIERGDKGFDRTFVHEVWHGLSRFLSPEDLQAVKDQYVREQAAYLKQNPWFKPFIGRDRLTPQQFEEWRALAGDKVAGDNTRPIMSADGKTVTGYGLRFNGENYRFHSLDEWFAETMADRTLSRYDGMDPRTKGVFALAKQLFASIARAVRQLYRPDVANRILDDFLNNRNQTMRSRMPLAMQAGDEPNAATRFMAPQRTRAIAPGATAADIARQAHDEIDNKAPARGTLIDRVVRGVADDFGGAFRKGTQAAKDVKNALMPTAAGNGARETADIVSANAAALAAGKIRGQVTLTNAIKAFRRLGLDTAAGRKASLDIMDRIERGVPQRTPELQGFADQMRDILDDRLTKIQALGTGKLSSVIQDYFPHIWEKPEQAAAMYADQMGKRPLEGPGGFLKQRSIDSLVEGVAQGLNPVSWNPAELTLLKIHEMDRYLMAQNIADEVSGQGRGTPIATAAQQDHWAAIRSKTNTLDSDYVTAAAPGHTLVSSKGDRYAVTGTDAAKGHVLATDATGKAVAFPRKNMGAFLARGGQALDAAGNDLGAKFTATPVTTPVVMTQNQLNTARTFAGADPNARLPDAVSPGNVSVRLAGQEYEMHPDAARIINNYLSPGLNGKPVYDVVRKAGSLLNQAQLGYSFFHAGFVTMDTTTSKAALGLEQIVNGIHRGDVGKALQGVGSLAKAAVPLYAPVETFFHGSKVLSELQRPGSVGGYWADVTDALQKGGGRVSMDDFYSSNAVKGFKDAIAKGNYPGAIIRAPMALVEGMSHPLMQAIVPRMKMGVFADLAREEIERLGPNPSLADQRAAFRSAWDTVDNRLGQVCYDNIFWNKVLKDSLMVGVRSVGWNLGTIRELGGGVLDANPLKFVERAKAGDPLVTHRLAYAMALPMLAGITGSMIHYMHTGQPPQDWKDALFPRTGRKNPDGSDERLTLPTYIKDVFAYRQAPLGTLLNKVNPLVSMLTQMYQNKDYFGGEIRNTNDPVMQQIGQELHYLLKVPVPFSVTGASKRQGGGVGSVVESALGVTPAPAVMSRTPAENAMVEAVQRQLPSGGKTPEEMERAQMRRTLMSNAQSGQSITPQLQAAVASHQMSSAAASRFTANAQVDPRLRMFRSLPVEEAQRVFQLGTPAEQSLFLTPLRAKEARAGVPLTPMMATAK